VSRLRRGSAPPDPRCFWCHKSIGALHDQRGHDPAMGLPAGVYVVVCGSGCPKRPADSIVGVRADWRLARAS
jgi:hypothetical protein